MSALRADFWRVTPGLTIHAALDIEPGVTILFGPSGAGKTTTIRCMAGLEKPDSGGIRFGDDIWFDSEGAKWLPPRRRRAGFMFQDLALFPHMTVEENVGYGLTNLSRPQRIVRVADLLDLLGIAGLAPRPASRLSGGEAQRVALARALAPEPRALFLDEPLSSLDDPTRSALQPVVRTILEQLDIPVIVVTHNRVEALALGNRLAVMSGGEILQSGPISEVFGHPASTEVAKIVGVETVISARITSVTGGIATVQTEGSVLHALEPTVRTERVYACVRAEDVTLEPATPHRTSARNRLFGRVTGVTDQGAMSKVTLDCGFDLAALVTKQAIDDLDLSPGAEIAAVIKAPAIQLVPR